MSWNRGTDGNDVIELDGLERGTAYGLEGDDTLIASGGMFAWLNGGTGNDVYRMGFKA